MATTALELINKSYYLSGIVGRDLETVSGQQQADGLDLLNAILDVKTTNYRLIPYWQRSSFTGVVGQEQYFINNLIAIEGLTFNIGSVRYSMLEQGRVNYFAQARVNNVNSLPYMYHLEREENGMNVYVYFRPNSNYTFEYTGKFVLTNVDINTDMTTVYDRFYIEYLRYVLASMICDENDIEFPAAKMMRLKQYEKTLMDVSPPDLHMQKMSCFKTTNTLNWAAVNIGRGWSAPY